MPGMPTCQTCGAPAPAGARFCPACGAPIALPADTGSRRPVTIVFTDIVGSTALGERLDAETLGNVMTRYYETMREAVERHGGAVGKFIGDAVVAAFGAPEVHEDDALRAVRAAHEMHAALDTLNDELERRWGTRLEVRTGVATGDVLAGGGAAVLGSPANLAARLQAAADDGEILLSDGTHRLVRDLVRSEPAGALELKGFESRVECFRLLDLEGTAMRVARTPHVGREHELALLELAYRRAMKDRRAQLATVLGEPGMGKTRLVDEAIARLEGDPLVLRGRCLPYGEGITFFPVGEAISAAAGIEGGDEAERAQAKVAAMVPADAAPVAARVSEAIGLGGATGAPEETLWAIRRFFELMAAERPLVLIFDDLQWAEPTLLDLVAQLVEHGRGAAELVIAVARTELHELHPDWAGRAANALTISLEPLGDDDGVRLARHLAAGGELDDALATRLVSTAGGNPLFLEEYVAMLVDDGILTKLDGRWLAPADLATAASTPPTLIGLLTSRLHRLPPDDREALMHASVIGKAFTVEELAALDFMPKEELEPIVDRLLDHEMIRVRTGAIPDAHAVEFQHQLLRDAAYASLPKARRAEVHERFANHLEVASAERPEELDELAGFHLAQAYAYRSELGAFEETTPALADRAAGKLSAAGRRAVERGDPRAAIRLLDRAISLASKPDLRAAMRLLLCNALFDVAEIDRYQATLADGLADAAEAGDDRLRTRFEHLRISFDLVHEPKATAPDVLVARIRAQAETLHSLGDLEGETECLYQLATVAWIGGDAAGFERSARQALEGATAAGNARLVGRATAYVIVALLRGSTPLPAALDELRLLRDTTALSRSAAATVQLGEAEMLACLGRVDEAQKVVSAAAADLTELGLRVELAAAASVRAAIADARDDLEDAERALRSSYDGFRAVDDATNGGVVAVDLAHVLARLGRHAEAEEMASAAAELAAGFDVEAQIGWRTASARARSALGDTDGAARLVREVTERLEMTDFTVLRADSLSAMADVFESLGRLDEAIDAIDASRRVYAAKGHVVGERRVIERLAALNAAHSS